MLSLTRHAGETWRQVVHRYAALQGLEEECLATFDAEVSAGAEEDTAAWVALHDWDCVPLDAEEYE